MRNSAIVAIYHKGVLDQTFNNLNEASKFVQKQLDNDWSQNENDWSYMFY